MKCRKKPVVVEFEQFTVAEIISETGATLQVSMLKDVYRDKWSKTGWSINTLEGKHEVAKGDIIITGVKGEKYPCKPDIFEMTYEKLLGR